MAVAERSLIEREIKGLMCILNNMIHDPPFERPGKCDSCEEYDCGSQCGCYCQYHKWKEPLDIEALTDAWFVETKDLRGRINRLTHIMEGMV